MSKLKRKSIGAVVAGLLAVIVVTTAVDIVLHVARVFPPLGTPIDDRMSLIAVSYRIAISVAAAYLTARLAPVRPMRHAVILGIIGTLLGALGVVATWGKGLGPAWYPIALAVLALPQCWLGGNLYELRSVRLGDEGRGTAREGNPTPRGRHS